MNTTLIMKSTIGALAVAVVASGMAFVSSPASAAKVNTSIKISKSKLKDKCNNSGGTFTTEGKKYSCVVNNKKSTTTVSCVNKRKCIGTILPTFRIITKSGYMAKNWSGSIAKR